MEPLSNWDAMFVACGFAACHTAPRKGVHKSLGTPERRSPELRLLPSNPFLW